MHWFASVTNPTTKVSIDTQLSSYWSRRLRFDRQLTTLWGPDRSGREAAANLHSRCLWNRRLQSEGLAAPTQVVGILKLAVRIIQKYLLLTSGSIYIDMLVATCSCRQPHHASGYIMLAPRIQPSRPLTRDNHARSSFDPCRHRHHSHSRLRDWNSRAGQHPLEKQLKQER